MLLIKSPILICTLEWYMQIEREIIISVVYFLRKRYLPETSILKISPSAQTFTKSSFNTVYIPFPFLYLFKPNEGRAYSSINHTYLQRAAEHVCVTCLLVVATIQGQHLFKGGDYSKKYGI